MKEQKDVSAREPDLLRAIRALGELDTYQYHRLNELYQRDSIIGYLKLRISELETALKEGHARLQELEGSVPPAMINESEEK